MARCSVFVDSGSPVAEALPDEIVGRRFDGEGTTIEEAIAQIPEQLQYFVAEAECEAHRCADPTLREGFVDRPSSGWWASATL